MLGVVTELGEVAVWALDSSSLRPLAIALLLVGLLEWLVVAYLPVVFGAAVLRILFQGA